MTTPRRLPAESPTLSLIGDIYSILVSGEETSGAYTMFHAIVPPGGGPPPHTHTREDENFFIAEGDITFTIAGKTLVARAGDLVHAPRNIPHTFTNTTPKPSRMIVTAVPAGVERMFMEIGERLDPGSTSPVPVTDAAIAKVVEACPRYGISLGGP